MYNKARHLLRGAMGERLAERFLKKQGLELVMRNFRKPFGEIDLVMRHGEVLVFVEVRLRKKDGQLRAVESISPQKQRRLRRAAAAYLQIHFGDAQPICRFDAVCIEDDGASQELVWIKNIMED